MNVKELQSILARLPDDTELGVFHPDGIDPAVGYFFGLHSDGGTRFCIASQEQLDFLTLLDVEEGTMQ